MYASIPDRYREEQVFIRELWFEPTDLSARLIYADWLEEHGDVRAELLRLDVQFLELDGRTDEASVKQYESLVQKRRKVVKPDHWQWVAMIGCCPITTCNAWQSPETDQVEFRFRCPRRWENLQPIGDDSSVRYCSECERSVHYCWDMRDAHQHARSGNCVALDPSVDRDRMDYDYDIYNDFSDRAELGELM